MRGKKVKALLRGQQPVEQASLKSAVVPLGYKAALGKTQVAHQVMIELTRPQGHWREFWTKHVRQIAPGNRLPRGFAEPKSPFDLNA